MMKRCYLLFVTRPNEFGEMEAQTMRKNKEAKIMALKKFSQSSCINFMKKDQDGEFSKK